MSEDSSPKPVSNAPALTNGVTLGLIVGLSGGAVLLIIIIIASCACKSKKRKGSDVYSTLCERSSLHSGSFSKSPPTPIGQDCTRAVPMNGVASEGYRGFHTPTEFCLPPERIQPSNPESSMSYSQFVGTLDPNLYRRSQSDDDDDDENVSSGKVWYSLMYDALVEELTIKVNKAKFLPGRDRHNTPRDPFVKIYLLPDEQIFYQTHHRKRTLSPKFNETFVFTVKSTEVRSRTLRLSVYDIDKRHVRHCLGHILVPLKGLDLHSDEEYCGELAPLSQPSQLGEINFALTYTPNTDKIKLVVIKARNLKKIELSKDTGVFAKADIISGRKMIKSKRTRTLEGSCELDFNEAISFTVTPKQIETCNIVVTIMTITQKRLGHYEQIYGSCTVGPFMFARGEELAHWQEMIGKPRTTVTKWHLLH